MASPLDAAARGAPRASSAPPLQAELSWHRREEIWAILISLLVVAAAAAAALSGVARELGPLAPAFPAWSGGPTGVWRAVAAQPLSLAALLGGCLAAFLGPARIMGWDVRRYALGFALLYAFSVLVTVLGSNQLLKNLQLETPLLALIVGMILGNTLPIPGWFQLALKTEFYVKLGIVLMGATLPFTLVLQAGPMAILQATIVATITFVTIYLAATRLFGMDPRFGACLGAGGSICGVSAAIAIGSACRAEKSHVSITISLVVLWAVGMVFVLPLGSRHLGLAPGPAGAWIGTSEFADAAGFAAAAAIGDERAVRAFTLMKVVGRDMFVGVWAVIVAFLSVTRWEGRGAEAGPRLEVAQIWQRFPKFILGFLLASGAVTVVLACLDADQAARFSREALGPIKTLRGWAFTWTFLSIGFTTRFRDLTRFGWKPLGAFTIGVLVNVPLGYWLSNVVFASHWLGLR